MRIAVAVAAALIAPVATSQQLQGGQMQGWTEQAVSLAYALPEPVGTTEVVLSVRDDQGLRSRPPTGPLSVVGGRIVLADGASVALPGNFLECLPYPRQRSVRLETFFYKDPSDDTPLTLDDFSFVVEISFGGRAGVPWSGRDVEPEIPSVSFQITGREVVRARFIRSDGEIMAVEPVADVCPSDELEWVAGP